ncbi:hypothetical protein [Staphylococcus pseudintermedius]|uniref:hypothetical protein n=1 Tax=Staphylococcus pseudintermedius TaxID=283734 RepID=UPI00286DBE8E|nr:hypothetical protein [Staphylococcus pseudintermedius]WMZ68188.1 hypothetical protein QS419_12385 [Staphylococcus pseudintermedius]
MNFVTLDITRSPATSDAVSTEASEFVSAVDSLSQATSNGSTTKEDASTFVSTVDSRYLSLTM